MPQFILAAAEVASTVAAELAPAAISTYAGIAAYWTVEVGLTVGLQVGLAALAAPHLPDSQSAATPLKQPRPPRRKGYGRRRLSGYSACNEVSGDGWFRGVLAVHDRLVNGVVQLYLNDDKVSLHDDGSVIEGADGRYGFQLIYVGNRLGLATETAYSSIVAALPGVWTDDHRGDGVASLSLNCAPVKNSYFQKAYPNGLPQLSAVYDLQPYWDPRDPAQDRLDPSTWLYGDNPFLADLHYRLVERDADYEVEIAPTLDLWKAAADVCDEAVELKAGGTEKRYRCAVVYDEINDPADIEAAIWQTCDGKVFRRGDGALVPFAGKYYEPTVSIGADEITDYTFSEFTPDESAVNELVVSYFSADHDYNQVQTDPWTDEDDIADRGAVRSDNFDPQVPSYSQARRLAKVFMARANARTRGTTTTNLLGKKVRGERFIHQTIVEAGETLFDGPIEILAVRRTFASGGVSYDWVAIDPSIYDWIPAIEEGDPAPTGDRVEVEPLDPPTITDAVAFLESTGAGGDGVGLRLTVTGPDRPDAEFFTRTRPLGATSWDEKPNTDVDSGPGIVLEIRYVAADTSVEVSVAVALGDGRKSDWSTPAVVVDTTLTGLNRLSIEGGGRLKAEDGDNLATET